MQLAAVILAGGQSRRMGQDKALLPMPVQGSQPLIAHISHIASCCTPQIFVLTPWPERYQRPWLGASVIWLPEKESPGTGPLVALNQAWSMIFAHGQQTDTPNPDWLLVLACDLPALEAAPLQTWCHQLSHVSANAIAALPHHQNRWEPLCGFYHRRCVPSLQQAVQQDIRSFQRWLANEPIARLDVKNFKLLQNCNTPAQWHQFLQSQKARKP